MSLQIHVLILLALPSILYCYVVPPGCEYYNNNNGGYNLQSYGYQGGNSASRLGTDCFNLVGGTSMPGIRTFTSPSVDSSSYNNGWTSGNMGYSSRSPLLSSLYPSSRYNYGSSYGSGIPYGGGTPYSGGARYGGIGGFSLGSSLNEAPSLIGQSQSQSEESSRSSYMSSTFMGPSQQSYYYGGTSSPLLRSSYNLGEFGNSYSSPYGSYGYGHGYNAIDC